LENSTRNVKVMYGILNPILITKVINTNKYMGNHRDKTMWYVILSDREEYCEGKLKRRTIKSPIEICIRKTDTIDYEIFIY